MILKIRPWLLLLMLSLWAAAPLSAQSKDPDNPTPLNAEKTIEGAVKTGSLSDKETTYYSFDVDKGTLELKLDVVPQDKSDGGGLVEWTLLDTKFQQLKYDNLAAQGTENRQIKELPVTVKRRLILKISVAGNVAYRFAFGGTALK